MQREQALLSVDCVKRIPLGRTSVQKARRTSVKIRTLVCSAAASLVCLGVAMAQPAGNGEGKPPVKRDPAKLFEKIDTDANGSLTMEEYKVNYDKRMEVLKSRAAVAGKEITPPTAEESFQKIDTDADGSISKEEFLASMTRPPKKAVGDKPEGEKKAEAEPKAE